MRFLMLAVGSMAGLLLCGCGVECNVLGASSRLAGSWEGAIIYDSSTASSPATQGSGRVYRARFEADGTVDLTAIDGMIPGHVRFRRVGDAADIQTYDGWVRARVIWSAYANDYSLLGLERIVRHPTTGAKRVSLWSYQAYLRDDGRLLVVISAGGDSPSGAGYVVVGVLERQRL